MTSFDTLGLARSSGGDQNVGGLGNPPTEILVKILAHLAPSSPLYSREGVDRSYALQRCQFATLRLVCIAWDEPVLELLLETTLLYTRGPSERVLRNLKVLEHRPSLIRKLEIATGFSCRDISKSDFDTITAEIIDRGLASCSNLREIRFIGDNFQFLDREWPRKTCPNLKLMVTSVKLDMVSTKRCSAILTGLGRELTNLEISMLHAPFGRGRMCMPSKLPRLSSLAWMNNTHVFIPLISKLVSRIVHEREDQHTKKTSPLRHLSLHDRHINAAAITNILTTNNVGAGLTSFRYTCRRAVPSDTGFAIAILKLCRGLTDFTFVPPCNGDIFAYLPRTIKRLDIAIASPDEIYPYTLLDPIQEFEKYLALEPRALEHISIRIPRRGSNIAKWESLLGSVDIPLVWVVSSRGLWVVCSYIVYVGSLVTSHSALFVTVGRVDSTRYHFSTYETPSGHNFQAIGS
ncbi:hypothetical protein BD779DRAFT_517203 [Infundibulicybe gibba]|nr:hypothetical protein BD779DRAFT_517203 [Infundibulicybe gibba]